MQVKKAALEQHIAVFGESGSGKTVLLSSFYGAAQEHRFLKESLFNVVADDIGLGARLHQNYLGMRDSARVPAANKFSATTYAFSVKLKESARAKAGKSSQFDALRLVWHDYPGEWFEQDVSGEEEARRRIDTFRSLLGSDVALMLVDGQKLLDNEGEEELYLKSLFGNFRNGLLALKDDLLENGEPLVEFPRIWVLALSKADLLPEMSVINFRDLLIDKAAGEIHDLRQAIAGFVKVPDALSVGEDFVLLSSAKFEPGKIEVDKRVGIDLVLPLAAILPFERHVKWTQRQQLPAKVADNLLSGAREFAAALVATTVKKPGPVGIILAMIGPDVIAEAAKMAQDGLRKLNAEALAKHNYVTAVLTRFRMDLNEGEEEQVLLRSLK
jgi:hypothetical protein